MDAFCSQCTSFESADQLSTRQLSVGPGPEELEDPQLSAGLRLKEPPGDGRCGSSFVCRQLDRDVHGVVEGDEKIANMHANAEKFDPRAEGDSIFTADHIVTLNSMSGLRRFSFWAPPSGMARCAFVCTVLYSKGNQRALKPNLFLTE